MEIFILSDYDYDYSKIIGAFKKLEQAQAAVVKVVQSTEIIWSIHSDGTIFGRFELLNRNFSIEKHLLRD